MDSTRKPLGCVMAEQDKQSALMTKFSNFRNKSFCEVILWCADGEIFGSGPNDPKDSSPKAINAGLDIDAIAKQYQVKNVSINPPRGGRFWTLDQIELPVSPNSRDFNAFHAYWWATVASGPTGEPVKLDPTQMKYLPIIIERNSIITFEKDKRVFLLDAPDGITWILKNYTTVIDSTITYESLPQLSTKLKLPAGWKFRTKILDQDLRLSVPANGKARIMWDELGDSWDALDPGVGSYQP